MANFHFPDATRAFLEGIAANNSKSWFDANRPLYDEGYVAAGRAFVEALGPELGELLPGLHYEPRVNGSLMRVNRDIRFSKDKRPYKDHLDLFFWQGETKSWDRPGFWFRLTASEVMMGAGTHRFTPEQLESFRQSVVHPRSARSLLAAVSEVRAKGDYWIGEKTRKLPPRGFEADPQWAEYLLYEGLTAGVTLPAAEAYTPDFGSACRKHFEACAPIDRWLLAEVAQ